MHLSIGSESHDELSEEGDSSRGESHTCTLARSMEMKCPMCKNTKWKEDVGPLLDPPTALEEVSQQMETNTEKRRPYREDSSGLNACHEACH